MICKEHCDWWVILRLWPRMRVQICGRCNLHHPDFCCIHIIQIYVTVSFASFRLLLHSHYSHFCDISVTFLCHSHHLDFWDCVIRIIQIYVSVSFASFIFLWLRHSHHSDFCDCVIRIIHIPVSVSFASFTFMFLCYSHHSYFCDCVIRIIQISVSVSFASFRFLFLSHSHHSDFCDFCDCVILSFRFLCLWTLSFSSFF